METAKSHLHNEDLYKLLNVQDDATDKEITKAYRTAALKVHPDKNPDDPLAAEKFRRLSEALQLLTDAAARAAYDKVRRGRLAAAERAKALGEGRRRFKEELERAEAAAFASAASRSSREDEARLEREKQRLRRELSEVLAREQELLRQEIRQAAGKPKGNDAVLPTIKLIWRDSDEVISSDSNAPIHTEASLRSLCSSYGEVVTLLYRPTKSRQIQAKHSRSGVAIVEFRRHADAARLVQRASSGLLDGLTAVWMQGEQSPSAPAAAAPAATAAVKSGDWLPTASGLPSGDWLRKVTAEDLLKMFTSRGGGQKRSHLETAEQPENVDEHAQSSGTAAATTTDDSQ